MRVAALAVVALAAGCGGGGGPAAERPATTAAAEDVRAACTNAVVGFTVRYPSAWHTRSLGEADACRRFHPDAFELVAGTDCCPLALEVHPTAADADRVLADYADPTYHRVVDRGRGEDGAAWVSVETTGEGLHPAGTRIHAWILPRGDGALVVQATAPPGEDRYAAWVPVVAEAARTLRLPAADGAGAATVEVFFANGRLQRDPSSCAEVFPRARAVVAGTTARERAAAALYRLLEGPTREERAAGYTSWFSAQTAGLLRAVAIVDGPPRVVRVDFDDFSRLLNGANTSCGSAALLAALERTVGAALPGATPVWSFGGDCTAFSEWLQTVAPACPPLDG